MKETKEIAVATALAKLTEEDKKVLGLIKTPKKPRVKKSYRFTVDYMIGDASGNTSMVETIDAKNPFMPLISDALSKLKPIKGRWGIGLHDDTFYGNHKDGNITELESDLLSLVSGYDCDEDEANEFFKGYGFEKSETNFDFLCEFGGLLIDDTEYSFLTYEGHTLK